ncbi:blr4433 [Bradyrhizobium diazoefficiens USDA 110]|uniref:Blr4433 protein n=2 Tax=Bradyrhizobium diazoefficiens TaxID=1355477 RepID=Q89LW0_BRADU|nr:hypothetical protein Bdiaspc4_23085 [Bradyrhizobium diazoefficiens]BAC49698.1 blr4433 [Bradyrhizobium diazoefficiens USDA 110]
MMSLIREHAERRLASAPTRRSTGMMIFRLSLKALAITVAVAALAGAAFLLARPQPIESAVLGADWECSQTAFVLTTCPPRVREAIPAVETSRKDAIRATRG